MGKPRPQLDLPTEDEVCARRDEGFIPVVLWLPPLGSAEFKSAVKHQMQALVAANESEHEVLDWLDHNFEEILADVDAAESG